MKSTICKIMNDGKGREQTLSEMERFAHENLADDVTVGINNKKAEIVVITHVSE